MSVTTLNIIEPKEAENAQTTQYTSDASGKTIIDKFTVTNTSAVNAQFSCNIVIQGDSPSDANLILKTRTIAPGENYGCPELIGQSLKPSGFISTLASASNSLTITATGRLIL